MLLAEADYLPVVYMPLDDVDHAVLQPSSQETYCPYNGSAPYYSLRDGDRIAEDAIWSSPTPYGAVHQIAGHVAFHPQHVDIEHDPS